jgi:magnesium-transporting ATPase (P-type)
VKNNNTELMNAIKKDKSLYESFATVCTLNNTANVLYKDGNFKRVGDPTECALKVLAEKLMNQPQSPNQAFEFFR